MPAWVRRRRPQQREPEPARRARLEEQYWTGLDAGKAAISLEAQAEPDAVDFHVYGMRLANRMVAHLEEAGGPPIDHSSILEIGCGVGRFVLPLACRFRHVHGIDISAEIIAEAREYCRSVPNVTLSVNDGETLAAFADSSVDYVLCAGVFQHIQQFGVIAGYLREAVRVLTDRGLFLFTFQVWQTQAEGSGRVGAKVTARLLDETMGDLPVEIVAMSTDPDDPVPHFLVVVRRTEGPGGAASFGTFPVEDRALRTGTFEDLPTRRDLVEAWQQPQRPVTFYDE